MDGKRGVVSGTRGQVTVFIIIGIVLVFSFAAVMFIVKSTTTDQLTAEGTPIISDAPQEFLPIQRYTENCLEQWGKRGLLIIGQQGGYIDPNLVGTFSATDTTEADGIDLQPTKIPYWHYNKAPNEAAEITFSSLRPELFSKDDPEMSIEAQLERFVNEKLDGCLLGYEPFIAQGYEIKEGSRKVDVTIGDDNVNFLLVTELDVSRGGSDTTLDKFFVRIPLRLKDYYANAKQIVDAQEEHHFVERHGLELISVYSAKDFEHLPPISDIGYEVYSALSWDEPSVKRTYRELLVSYVPQIRYLGSRNFEPVVFNDPITQQIANNMVLPLSGAEPYTVDFDYLDWEPYLRTNSRDGVIKPESLFINYEILTYSHQRYETHYDVSYPVLIGIGDELALDGDGYSFMFAVEANIRNNALPVGGAALNTYLTSPRPTVCDEIHRDTELVRTIVVDSFTQEPVDLVHLGFTIPNQDECDMGVTNFQGEFKDTYPPVYGGMLNLIKEGYLTSFYPMDTYVTGDQPLITGYAVAGFPEPVIEMHKFRTINVSVKKKPLGKCILPSTCEYVPQLGRSVCSNQEERCFFDKGIMPGNLVATLQANGSLSLWNNYYYTDQTLDLGEDEEAIITLTKVADIREGAVTGDHNVPVIIDGVQDPEAKLVPGVYSVAVKVIRNTPLQIPQETRTFEDDDDLTFEMQETNLAKVPNGDLNWNTEETYLTITPEDLYSNNLLTFYVPSQELHRVPLHYNLPGANQGEEEQANARVIEDLQMMGKLQDLSKEKRRQLEPTWS